MTDGDGGAGGPEASAEGTVEAVVLGAVGDVDLDGLEEWVIERAVLNDDPAGREITAGFVRTFGAFVSNEVRPVLRRVAASGGEPQLLVNGLAELLRSTADSIEFPLDHPRSSTPATGEDG